MLRHWQAQASATFVGYVDTCYLSLTCCPSAMGHRPLILCSHVKVTSSNARFARIQAPHLIGEM
jgi:hypothetical protein